MNAFTLFDVISCIAAFVRPWLTHCTWYVCKNKFTLCTQHVCMNVFTLFDVMSCDDVFVRQWFTLCTSNFDTCVFTLCIWHIGISLLALCAHTHTYRYNMCHMFIWVFSHIVAHMYIWHTCTYAYFAPNSDTCVLTLCIWHVYMGCLQLVGALKL